MCRPVSSSNFPSWATVSLGHNSVSNIGRGLAPVDWLAWSAWSWGDGPPCTARGATERGRGGRVLSGVQSQAARAAPRPRSPTVLTAGHWAVRVEAGVPWLCVRHAYSLRRQNALCVCVCVSCVCVCVCRVCVCVTTNRQKERSVKCVHSGCCGVGVASGSACVFNN